jgi:protein TonB
MPGVLFQQPDHSRARRPRQGGTLTASIILHAAALAGLVAWQLHAAAGTPTVAPRLVVALPAPPPVMPPPAPRTPEPVRADASPMPDPTAAPVAAPDINTPEPAVPRGAPMSSVVVASPGGSPGAITGTPGVSLGGGAPPPEPPGPVRVFSGVRPPRQLVRTRPDYPPTARAARVEGTVILEATIDETGVVRDLKILRSIPLLDRAAIAAVSRWRYEPTRLNGQPVAIVMTVTVTFRLK